jgi:hypothetical protein
MLAKSREDRPQDPRQLQEEIETVITKLAAEFSPSPGQIAPASAPVAPEAASPADDNLELATLLPAVASPSFDHYFGIQIGSLLGDRYRLIEEEREGTGGRLFRATEEKALSGTPWISAVRFAPVEAFAQLERSLRRGGNPCDHAESCHISGSRRGRYTDAEPVWAGLGDSSHDSGSCNTGSNHFGPRQSDSPDSQGDVVLTFITRLQLHPDCRRCR